MRTADRRMQGHPRRGKAQAGAVLGWSKGRLREQGPPSGQFRSSSPPAGRGCGPAAGPGNFRLARPGFACGYFASPEKAGGLRPGGAARPGKVIHFSTATFVHSCIPADQRFTQITHRPIHRTLPWQAQGWRDRSKLSCWPWSACVLKVTGGARRARDCSPAQVARHDQRRPGLGGHRRGDYRNGAAKPACAATGAAPSLPPSRGVPVPLR